MLRGSHSFRRLPDLLQIQCHISADRLGINPSSGLKRKVGFRPLISPDISATARSLWTNSSAFSRVRRPDVKFNGRHADKPPGPETTLQAALPAGDRSPGGFTLQGFPPP
jgi:hypothetical protein